MKKLVISALLLTHLSGCAHLFIEPEVVTLPIPVFEPPPAVLLEDCPISSPPDRAAYLAADVAEQKTRLMMFSAELLSDIKECNLDKKALREWVARVKKMYANPAEVQSVHQSP